MGPVLKFFFCLFLGTGFSFLAQTGTTLVDSIKDVSGYRVYRLYLPPNYSPANKIPLVLNLHGLGSNGFQQELYGDFRKIADTANFLILHPEGNKSASGQYWNAGLLSVPDDVQFINRLLDSIITSYAVEKDRIYACGLSNGGILSYFLACSIPGRITAVASVAGTMFRTWYGLCKPAMAKPVLVIHGTEDGTVPYAGNGSGGLYVATDSCVEKWREHNHCQVNPIITQLPDVDLTDFSNVTHFVYAQGADNSSVELFKVNGGSHSWPGASLTFFHQNMDFSASKEIWRFFRQYRLSQFVTQVGLSEPEQTINGLLVYPNPVSDKLVIESETADRFCVISSEGKKLIESNLPVIDVKHLAAGLYFLEAWKDGACVRKKFIRE